MSRGFDVLVTYAEVARSSAWQPQNLSCRADHVTAIWPMTFNFLSQFSKVDDCDSKMSENTASPFYLLQNAAMLLEVARGI